MYSRRSVENEDIFRHYPVMINAGPCSNRAITNAYVLFINVTGKRDCASKFGNTTQREAKEGKERERREVQIGNKDTRTQFSRTLSTESTTETLDIF